MASDHTAVFMYVPPHSSMEYVAFPVDRYGKAGRNGHVAADQETSLASWGKACAACHSNVLYYSTRPCTPRHSSLLLRS